jgi:uncharacterized protein YbjT (DUF2867 family)
MFGYVKMKGEIEEHIKELDFDHTIIVQPGLLVGHREQSRGAEGVLRALATGMGKVSNVLKDFWAQDAEVVARASISAALKAEVGEIKERVIVIGQKDIVRLGRTEWKGPL